MGLGVLAATGVDGDDSAGADHLPAFGRYEELRETRTRIPFAGAYEHVGGLPGGGARGHTGAARFATVDAQPRTSKGTVRVRGGPIVRRRLPATIGRQARPRECRKQRICVTSMMRSAPLPAGRSDNGRQRGTWG